MNDYVLPILGTVLTALAGFIAKSVFPAWRAEREKQREHERKLAEEAGEEQRRQREHEREQADAGAAAEQSEQVALYSQLTQLQTEALRQNSLLMEFLMNLATSGSEHLQQAFITALKEVSDNWSQARYEARELNTKITVMVSLAGMDQENREEMAKIPRLLLEFK